MSGVVRRILLVVGVLGLAGAPVALLAQTSQPPPHEHHHAPAPAPPQSAAPTDDGDAPSSRHITMEELHRLGGTPRGWKFTLPAGDATGGK